MDILQPKLVKREIVRPKYRLKADRSVAPLLVPAEGGARRVMCRPGLIAWVALSKYVDHAPLAYRLEQMSARWGAPISRQSMCDWIELASEWLAPIYRRMLINLRAGGYLQADETPLRCHDPDERKGTTAQGWLWVISRPGGDVVFDWRLSRRHGELNTLLADYKGILQSDGYEAYPSSTAENHEGVVWVGCWADARRKFNEGAVRGAEGDPGGLETHRPDVPTGEAMGRGREEGPGGPREAEKRGGFETLKWLKQ